MVKRNRTGEIQYLRIIGQLHPQPDEDSSPILKLKPGYLTNNPRDARDDPKSPIVAQLFDEEDELLGRYGLWALHYCIDGKTPPELAVRGKIPFPSATRSVRFYWKNNPMPIHELGVSEGKPQIEITWEAHGFVAGRHTITWIGSHPQNKYLQYFLRYSHDDGDTWQQVGWRTDESSQEIDFDRLPGGDLCKVAVVATDGVNTSIAETGSFNVPKKPCIATIFPPEKGTQIAPDESIILHGQGYYMEENTAETKDLSWTSSKDGELGKGKSIEIPRLSIGHHAITLTAGNGERAGKAYISIQVGDQMNTFDKRFWIGVLLALLMIAIILSYIMVKRPL